MSETISVHNMFSPCSAKRRASDKDLPVQLKKMQLNKEKGLKRLEVMLEDMENVLVELKKMVDNCLTHTKLCDNPPPSVTLGKNLHISPFLGPNPNLTKYSTKFWSPRMLGFKLGLIESDL